VHRKQHSISRHRYTVHVCRCAFVLALSHAAATQVWGHTCSNPRDPDFYKGSAVRRIELRNPLSFIFLVRQRMDEIKASLPLAEAKTFSREDYEASTRTIEDAVREDGLFGDSAAKVVVVTAAIENCMEDANPKTVDIVYRIFSSDPIPTVRATPEQRRAAVDGPATTASEHNTRGSYKVRPMLGYDDAHRGFGGADLVLAIPATVFDDVHVLGSESPTSRALGLELDSPKAPNLRALDRVDYHVAYRYSKEPASDLVLSQETFQARFTGFSKQREIADYQISLRYGASLDAGNQHSDAAAASLPTGTITNAASRTFRGYAGIAGTGRYSEAAISYGLQVSQTGATGPSSAKHIGDLVYGNRFPARTHAPWDVQARVSLGAIAGSENVLLGDRFFGGSSVSGFIPGDAWFIPNGPLVRSISSQSLNGEGFGGTSFYSMNVTVGKVIKGSPLIPAEIQTSDGFAQGISAAEDSAEGFFADDYLASSPEFTNAAKENAGNLKADLVEVQATFQAIRKGGTNRANLNKVLRDAEKIAQHAQSIIRHATVPDDRGRLNTLGLTALSKPDSPSSLPKLINDLQQLQPLALPAGRPPLSSSQAKLSQHLSDLRTALDMVKAGPVGQQAAAHAKSDMKRPREVIDALQFEVNRNALSVVGLFDAGRVWPDAHGTRYAIGGGLRFSLVNVNVTAGYAFNPSPHTDLGQGRGAVVFALTYTNFFR
jgi:hypothetical protein